MNEKLTQLYLDYKRGKISSNQMCDQIVAILIAEKQTSSICDFIVEEHVKQNLREKFSKKLQYLKNI